MPYTIQDELQLKQLLGVEDLPSDMEPIFNKWQKRVHGTGRKGAMDLGTLLIVIYETESQDFFAPPAKAAPTARTATAAKPVKKVKQGPKQTSIIGDD